MIALYRALLFLYPASWRVEYASEMEAIFEDRLRDTPGRLAAITLWLETLADLISNAMLVQADVSRQDIRQALRKLRAAPGFALTACITAALGIGATTAAYTMVNHVLLRPLPYRDFERLVKLSESDLTGQARFYDVSPANYRDWKNMSRSYESMGAYRVQPFNLTDGQGEPEHLEAAAVTAEALPALGVQPALGRAFSAADDRLNASKVALLSYGLWQQRFAGDPSVLGRGIRLDGEPYTVIGVMPRNFFFPERTQRLWTTMRFRPDDFEDRSNFYIFPIARLKQNVSLSQAQAEAQTIAAQLAREYPKEMATVGISVQTLRQDAVNDRSRLTLRVLLCAALCVLLIACTNLANLLMARALTRRRELAVRTALGAGRERLLRQMLTESVIIAVPGGFLGILIARAALPILTRLVPVSLPLSELPAFDFRVLLFAALVTLATGICFGLIPALRTGDTQSNDLREAGRSTMGARHERLRSGLVVLQITCSIVLLTGCGLLTRALWRIQAVPLGFRADHVLTLRTALPMPQYETAQAREPFYRSVLEQTRRLPGVTAAAYISFLPVAFGGGIWPVEIAGIPEDIAHRSTAALRFVTPGYFQAMGIPLLSGRDIGAADTHNAPWVAVVSQSFVDRYWPSQNPLGRHFDFGNHDRVVIGVAGNVKMRGPERADGVQVYLSWLQADHVAPWYAPKDLVIRTTGDPLALASAVRPIIRAVDPLQPVSEVRTLTQVTEQKTEARRVQLAVLSAFGAIALILAALGIHGLLSFAVSTRSQEIGVRLALGARRSHILAMTFIGGLRLAAIGVVIGVSVAYGIGRMLESLLAGVNPSDLSVFATAAGVSFLLAIGGGLAPALRAIRVDPVVAIRAE